MILSIRGLGVPGEDAGIVAGSRYLFFFFVRGLQ